VLVCILITKTNSAVWKFDNFVFMLIFLRKRTRNKIENLEQMSKQKVLP